MFSQIIEDSLIHDTHTVNFECQKRFLGWKIFAKLVTFKKEAKPQERGMLAKLCLFD